MVEIVMQRRKFVQLAGAVSLAGLAGCSGGTDDGDFPSSDLRIVIPYSEGGGSDMYARQIGGVLEDETGEAITLENHEGSGGMIGVQEVVNSSQEGHDIFTHNLPTIALEHMQQDIDIFDLDDLRGQTIAVYATDVRMTVKNPDLDVETYEDLIDIQDEIDYGTPGGTEMGILQKADELHGFVPNNHVTYDGGADAAAAVASGELDIASAPEGNFEGPIESGDVEPFFVWASSGSSIYEDVPTIADDEMGGFEEFDWLSETQRAFWSSPDASDETLEWWEDALEDTMTSDEMESWSEETGSPIQFDGRDDANQAFEDAIEGMEEDIDIDEL
ncbi:Tripartite-type tricarboxylate transporter, receptor component TctC [Natronorubrum sediminis]|uniref:Tripartite-type tricarboxylate transporter, receptor component TctC n=1 Tax=Natronorubrum sediminis TaxID=640943 RepID=A0A1H6FUP8_9EURY|nr:tripartite tricarboxylate transporter substrate-binding protein [Natronorubrum sediminis]SEH13564.1 Tripartite-type tricarboxylate transporter, receptor component TctC [Natronorubrum sediminis]